VLHSAGDALILPPRDFAGRWLERAVLAGLFILGAYLWADALNWGQIPWDRADWYDITGPRLFFLQEAVQNGQLPLHVDDPLGMKNATDRFLSIPDVFASPQIVLLRWLTPGAFVLLQTLALYALGYWGLLRLKRQWQLSLAAFIPLYLLFNFNGHLVVHVAVGHAGWGTVFLFSWFVLWTVQLLESGGGWRWAARISLLLAFIFLQGGFHPFLWCWLFLAVLLLFRWRLRKPLLLALAFALLLSMGRILPAAIVTQDLRIGFLSGFTTTAELLAGLVILRGPAQALETVTPLNPLVAWWEFDYYIGWAGLAFVALGGGLLVRHLVLPGGLAGTKEVMRFLAKEISPDTYVNLMAQYRPAYRAATEDMGVLSRPVTAGEVEEAYAIARKAGLHRFDARRPFAGVK